MSRSVSRILEIAVKAATAPMGKERRLTTLARLANRLTPVVKVRTARGVLKFSCPSKLAFFYPRTLFTNEPETLAWIDGFDDGDVFWDIGANIGVYSLYAAQREGVRVLAFEPGAANYATLNTNIELNGCAGHLSAYCVAFDENVVLGSMEIHSTEAGGVMNNFRLGPEKGKGDPSWQGALGFSVDGFVETFAPPFPTHMKIDVDGHERRILAGAGKTLANRRLRSLMVEAGEGASGDDIAGLPELAGLRRRDDLISEARREVGQPGVNLLFVRP